MALSTSSIEVFLFALSIVFVFILTGVIQVAWLRSRGYLLTSWPLDGGLTLGGQPLFGKNKTVGGIILLVPLVVLGIVIAGGFLQALGCTPIYHEGNSLNSTEWILVGTTIASGYIFGELVNSFVKRRFGIPPGQTLGGGPGRVCLMIVDQLDSVAGSLLFFSILVSVSYGFVVSIVVVGGTVHLLFNILLFKLGMKSEAR